MNPIRSLRGFIMTVFTAFIRSGSGVTKMFSSADSPPWDVMRHATVHSSVDMDEHYQDEHAPQGQKENSWTYHVADASLCLGEVVFVASGSRMSISPGFILLFKGG